MEKDRFDWIMSGLNWSRLNKFEKGFIEQVQEKFEQVENITRYEEDCLEKIYRSKAR